MTRHLLFTLGMLLSLNILTGQQFDLYKISTYHTGVFDEGAAEIAEFDPATKSVFFTNADANAITVLDLSDPNNPVRVTDISQADYGAGVNSVSVKGDLVAVAVEAENTSDNGMVTLWRTDGTFITAIEVGVLPDMVTFTNAGDKIIVANEGEPSDDYTEDPEGTISIIDLSSGVENPTVTTADFSAFTDVSALTAQGIRLFGPGATPAQDLEPEYVTISDDDATAYVVCQENNALAVVDIASSTVTALLPLGYKNHAHLGNGIDASNRDEAINIQRYNVLGMYMPDAIDFHMIGGTPYIFSANEGDARDYDGFSEEARVADLTLDPDAYPDAATLQLDENLGRLNSTTATGDTDGDGDIDQIYSYGARSFSIWNAETGEIVWDSGDEFEQFLAANYPSVFNSTNDETAFDNRSDDKGPEPEAIRIAELDGRVYALIGLERFGGIFVYDVTNVNAPKCSSFINNRNFNADPASAAAGDLGVEDIKFIDAENSPTGYPMVMTANEVSGTVTFFSVNQRNPTFDPIFDEEIVINDFAPTTLVMPPSPLSTQVVFVGGYDVVQTTKTYGNPAGQAIAKEWHDFIGFTPDDSGESVGWITVNHEQIYRDDRIGDGGGMTAFRINKDDNGEIVVMDQTLDDGREGKFFNVDFVNTVGETGMNCAGISAPNGRIWTAEEWFRRSNEDVNNGVYRSPGSSWLPQNPSPNNAGFGVRDTADFTIEAPEFPLVDGMTVKKYENFNYMTEVDPKQAVAIRKQYNWGRAGWEGGAITEDGKYVYLGIDGSPAPWVRYEADEAWDFTNGTLAVFKHDNALGERWIEVPETVDNMLGGLTDYAWEVGATMYIRNEWVAIDQNTGKVYWTETGRDSGSSGPGILFSFLTDETNAVIAPHHIALAQSRGFENALDLAYQDYYGRVLVYDPATEEVSVAIDGGPFYESDPSMADYPDKHLSNPDGLNILNIGEKTYLMIQEDLNGSSFGRTPEGISNRLCELFLLDVDIQEPNADDLVRVTAVPEGAEITGAIQIDDNTILLNSQHPASTNPFPYNHSLTLAIHGFADVDVAGLDNVVNTASTTLKVDEFSRTLTFEDKDDFALYNEDGKRMKVFRNAKVVSLEGINKGNYYLLDSDKKSYELTIK